MTIENVLYAYALWRALKAPRFHAWLSPINLNLLSNEHQSTFRSSFRAMLETSYRIFGEHKNTKQLLHHVKNDAKGELFEFAAHHLVNQAFYQAQYLGDDQYHLVTKGEIGEAFCLIAPNAIAHTEDASALLWQLAVAFAAGHTRFFGVHTAPVIVETHSLYVHPRQCVDVLKRAARHASGSLEGVSEMPRTMFITNPSIDFAAKVLLCAANIIPKDIFDRQLVENLFGLMCMSEALYFYKKPSEFPYGKYVVLAENIQNGMNQRGLALEKTMKKIFGDRVSAALVMLPLIASIMKRPYGNDIALMLQISDILSLPHFEGIVHESDVGKRAVRWVNAVIRHRELFPDIESVLSSATMLYMVFLAISRTCFYNAAEDTDFMVTYLDVLDTLLYLHEKDVCFSSPFHVYVLSMLDFTMENIMLGEDFRQAIVTSPVYNRVKQHKENIANSLSALCSIEPLMQSMSQKLKKGNLLANIKLLESALDNALSTSDVSPFSLQQ